MFSSKHHYLIGIVLLIAVSSTTAYAFTVPPADGFVRDDAGVLSTEEEQSLEQILTSIRTGTSNEIAILLTPTLDGEPIADVAVEVGREWGVGREDVNNGLLILAAIDDREIMIATGYGLEGAVPDVLAKHIIDGEITPHFREGNYAAGLLAGVRALEEATRGEYEPVASTEQVLDGGRVLFFFLFFVLPWLGAILGRTKSWWLGGVIGVIGGVIIWLIMATVLFIPLLGLIGLVFDFVVSKNYRSSGKTNWWAGGGWGPGGGFGGGGGGFGGFGGGSFGGGGASGRW